LKWKRHQMRQKLRAVHDEERREREKRDNDRRYH
jgi:hypothetical protein